MRYRRGVPYKAEVKRFDECIYFAVFSRYSLGYGCDGPGFFYAYLWPVFGSWAVEYCGCVGDGVAVSSSCMASHREVGEVAMVHVFLRFGLVCLGATVSLADTSLIGPMAFWS